MSKCCAPNCDHSQKSTEYRFFEFPQDPVLRAKWIANIGRRNWTPGRRSLICSAHFEETQFKMENCEVQILEGAVPTLFQSSRKRRGFRMPKSTSFGDLESSGLGEVRNKRLNQHCSKTEEEMNNAASHNPSSYVPMAGVNLESAKFMDEMVLIDGTYIFEACELTDSKMQTSNSSMNCNSLKIASSDYNVISSHNACYPLLDNTTLLGEEGSTTQENVIIVESTEASDEILVIPHSPQSKSDSVILVQQPLEEPIAGCKPPLNFSEIATPCSMTPSASADSEQPPEHDFQIQTEILNVPPAKRCKVTREDFDLSAEEDDEETIQFDGNEIMEPSEHVLSIEKGVVHLPVSLKHHTMGKHTNEVIKWQDGTFMCRLCGIASNRTVNLFSSEAKRNKLLERITAVLPIMIVHSDDLPQNVCSKCLCHLDACSEFIVTSFNTHKQLASVMGQDINQSSQLPVYFHERKKNHSNPDCKRHILLMEVCHEDGKPVEEYLSIALKDLHMRLHPKKNSSKKPKCSLLLASISNYCSVSQLEQARTAAEALVSKGVIQDEKAEQVPIRSDKEDRGDEFITIADISLEQDSNEAASITSSHEIKAIECMHLVEPASCFEQNHIEVQAMPVTDDVSPSDHYSTGIRCPKFQQSWKKRGAASRNLQNFVCWKTGGGEVKLTCKICECILGSQSDVQDHLREHSKISCHYCLAVFHSEDESDAHECDQMSVDGKLWFSENKRKFRPWYQCSFCNARLDSKPTLKKHMVEQHAANTKCESCGHDASDVCEATLHRQTCPEVRKEKEWQCRKCLEIFLIEEELQKHHVLSGHADVTSWLCDICGKSFPQSANLFKHKKTHLPSEFKYIHQCPYCPKRYISSSRLKEHMQKHEEKKYMCKVCGKLFSTKQILRQHEFTHGDPQFLCSLCSRTFFRKSHLLKHMNVHNPDNSRASRAGPQPHRDGLNRCRECRDVFEQKDLLLHYKLSHPQIQLENYICEICKEENTSYAELFQHQREVHKTGVKDCPFCEKTIDSSTQMKYHLMRHEGMFPYNCPMCNNGYTANSILQDHIRRKHTGEKPFECQQCSKRFPTNGALAQHSTVHSLPHQLLPCPVCNQGFKRKAHLDVHLRTHTGEKPYPCPICDRPFRQRPDCIKHVRVIHGEDPSNYDIRYHPNMCVTFPQVVSVADMELVLEGEDLMQASLEANQLLKG